MIWTIVIILFAIAGFTYLVYKLYDEEARQVLFSKEYTREKFVAVQKKADIYQKIAITSACIPVGGGILYVLWWIWYYLCGGMFILEFSDSFLGFIILSVLSIILLLYFINGLRILFRI